MYGELVPLGGGDPIPLLKDELLVGRRESCDIVLRFANVSAHHCQLTLKNGYWFVRDLQSRNGCKVNGIRVQEKRVDPDDTISVAKHSYKLQYSPADLGAMGPPPADDMPAELMTESLLTRAGLEGKRGQPRKGRRAAPGKLLAGKRGKKPQVDDQDDRENKRYDVLDDSAGQIKLPDKPV